MGQYELKWQRIHNKDTCENVHALFDGATQVAKIRAVKHPRGRFEVQIKQNVPWHRKTLGVAKSDCEFVYLNAKTWK